MSAPQCTFAWRCLGCPWWPGTAFAVTQLDELDEAEVMLEAFLQDVMSVLNSVQLLQQRIINTERCVSHIRTLHDLPQHTLHIRELWARFLPEACFLHARFLYAPGPLLSL